MSERVRVGLTLPSFVRDPATALMVARTAEDCGVDGVFVYDHVFRTARDGTRRPALEAVALLGALAAATTRVKIGALVLRASMRPPASNAAAVNTVTRIAPGRVLIGVGAGDSESREENESFGLAFGTVGERVETLEEATRAMRDRGAPIWVGGLAPSVRAIAAREADGWNAWGIDAARFGAWVTTMRSMVVRERFEYTWGGLAVVGESDDAAQDRAARLGAPKDAIVGGPSKVAAAIRELGDAGASWVILGAVDASDPRTAQLLGDAVAPLL